MADDITLQAPTSTGDTIRADELGGGVKAPATKILLGDDGDDDGFVHAGNPLPAILASNSGVDIGDVTVANGTGANSVPVQGAAAIDAAIAANPVLLGGRAASSPPSDVSADDDVQALWLTRKGALNIADGGGSLTVDGAVTANAGTNLNTSALALESGGNLAAAVTALQVMDDWDESDRAKVNVIAGQAGITAGAGAVAANTPRVTHASDDPVTTALQIMDDWDEGDRAKVNAQEVSGVMIENAVAVTVKYAVIDAASSGNNTLVSAVSGKKIRVLSLFLVAAGTVNVRFESGADGTALTGQMNLIANTGFVLPHNPHGWFQTADNTLLNLELSAGISVDGSLTYVEAE